MQSKKGRDAKHKEGHKAIGKGKVGQAVSENHKMQMQSEKRRDAKHIIIVL